MRHRIATSPATMSHRRRARRHPSSRQTSLLTKSGSACRLGHRQPQCLPRPVKGSPRGTRTGFPKHALCTRHSQWTYNGRTMDVQWTYNGRHNGRPRFIVFFVAFLYKRMRKDHSLIINSFERYIWKCNENTIKRGRPL